MNRATDFNCRAHEDSCGGPVEGCRLGCITEEGAHHCVHCLDSLSQALRVLSLIHAVALHSRGYYAYFSEMETDTQVY